MKCPLCPNKFDSKKSLRKHLMKVHEVPISRKYNKKS